MGRELGRQYERYRNDDHGTRVTTENSRQSSLRLRSRKLREHGDSDRLRSNDDDDVEAVGREQAVRLGASPELASDDDADCGGGTRDDKERDGREGSAPERS